MTDYTQTTDFSAKDSLPSGNSEKLILGSDFDTEFSDIQSAVNSKFDSSDSNLNDINSLSDPGADRILFWDDSASAIAFLTVNTGLAISTTNLNLSHLGLESLSDPGADRILFWDDSAGNLAWLTLDSDLGISGTTLSVTDTALSITESQISDLQSYLVNVVEDTTPQLGGDLDCQDNNLDSVGVVYINEQANASADIAGDGQIWVKTATPNELWFTDDAGNDIQIAASGTGVLANEIKVKNGDEAISSSATLQDDDDLAGFSLDTGGYYLVEGYLEVSTPSAADFKMQLTYSNAPQVDLLTFLGIDENGGQVDDSGSVSGSTVPLANASFSSGVQYGLIVRGHVLANGTTGGTVKLQWAQNTSNGGSTTVHKGSWIRLTRIA